MTSMLMTHYVPIRERVKVLLPGFLLCALVAMAAQFVSEHSGAPAMLMAILFGMAISSLNDDEASVNEGVSFTAKSILKLGIVLLGTRISADTLMSVGWEVALLVLLALIATISAGLVFGRMLGQSTRFSILTAGAVAICGASAALAISSVLPQTERSEKQLFLTVLGVTALSTIAMIIYPAVMSMLGINDIVSGAYIGATIHDVAQVIGAGFSISEPAGSIATLVKLIRVSLLAPTVLIVALVFRDAQKARAADKAPPLLPLFIIGFIVLAAMNSFGLIDESIRGIASSLSNAALLTAIAAVGVKTNLREVLAFGYAPIALIFVETIFIASFAAIGFYLLNM